ncbi:unnamed protein product [Brassica rapa subsp. narinosa]
MFYCVAVSGSWSPRKKVLWSFQSAKSSIALVFDDSSSFFAIFLIYQWFIGLSSFLKFCRVLRFSKTCIWRLHLVGRVFSNSGCSSMTPYARSNSSLCWCSLLVYLVGVGESG